MTRHKACPSKQEEPDEDHDHEPENQTGECRPLGKLSLAKAQYNREPKGQRLHFVAQRSVADGTNDIERHQDSKGAVRDPFRRVPHRISNTRAPVKFVPMLSGASLAAHLDLDYGALEVIHLGANAHSETDSLEV